MAKRLNVLCVDYWVSKGHTEEESKVIIGKLQKERNVLCVEHWVKKGFTENDARDRIKVIQRERSPRCIEYWVKRGFTDEDSKNKISELQSRTYSDYVKRASKKELRENSPRCIEYWIKRGYSNEDSRVKAREFNDNSSLNSYIERHGKEKGRELYIRDCDRRSLPGEKNPMFGKSAPKGSGNGISGFYRDYYFRSLLEYYYMKMMESQGITFICNDVSRKKNLDKIVIKLPSGKNYIPDFVLPECSKIVEIKSSYNLSQKDTQEKIRSLGEFCRLNSMTCQVLTEKDITQDINVLREDFRNSLLVIDKGKLDRFMKYV